MLGPQYRLWKLGFFAALQTVGPKCMSGPNNVGTFNENKVDLDCDKKKVLLTLP